MPSLYILLLRLLMALLIGALIGAERELKSKSAGFRTITLICVGSFLFTTFSIYISPQTPDRIASNIVTGIGFIGAGVIFKSTSRVHGLTTAATIWLTAALGMGVATGLYIFVGIATVLMLFSQYFMVKLEGWIDRVNQYRSYKVTLPNRVGIVEEYERIMTGHGLSPKREGYQKQGPDLVVYWNVRGKKEHHLVLIDQLLADEQVRGMEV
jgi:putative Mg2+ transporter-C (MgtC) family protein